ncbi:HD domain-containing protein [Neorhizobium sp. JUb45]|uniref:HD domain-containing protein n=1 Tax=Neorhizobium sp. JUb45 TaxID=2485113 RepID=UPI00104FE74C|nr:HD domain-containing protein [Neorhizobium sp. JUb45]TCQ95362.1 putative nucleotidyltransferase with HDIG domain [Neorhizobium sp. JUb45]
MYKSISREHILEDLPEIADIQSAELREKVIDAWVFALQRSSFDRVTDISGEGSPNIFSLKRGTQDAHLRGVTRLALAIYEEFKATYPEAKVDRDIILAGGLCHDIGKTWEFDPEKLKRSEERGDRYGDPTFRHSAYGAHVCLSVGLPDEVGHICMGHAMEFSHIGHSTECFIIRQADHTWWHVAAALDLCHADTIAFAGKNIRVRPLGLE